MPTIIIIVMWKKISFSLMQIQKTKQKNIYSISIIQVFIHYFAFYFILFYFILFW